MRGLLLGHAAYALFCFVLARLIEAHSKAPPARDGRDGECVLIPEMSQECARSVSGLSKVLQRIES